MTGELEPSEELNGSESETEKGSGKNKEEKQNLKVKFFMRYMLFDSMLYLFLETAFTIAYSVIMILLIVNSGVLNIKA